MPTIFDFRLNMPRNSGLDPDAAAYGAILQGTDGVSLGGNYTPESVFFAGLKADGLWTKLKAAMLFGYGTQASCRREIKTLTQGTIPGGTVTALSGRVSFTGNGSIRFPSNADTYVTLNSCAMALDFYDLPATGVYDFGCRNVTPTFCLFRYAAAIGIAACLGNFADILTAGSQIAGPSLYMMARTSATNGGHYQWDGTTFSTIATSSSLSGGSIPPYPPSVGALNAEGTDAGHSNARYRSCWIFDGMSSAQWQLFCTRYQAFKVARGWV